jgi:diguanylate cyclase (GGDEF)-like protein
MELSFSNLSQFEPYIVQIVPLAALAIGLVIGGLFGSGRSVAQLVVLRRVLERVKASREQSRAAAEELRGRLASATDGTASLERSLPEIAQRLSATRDLSEIPGSALDLVQEIFKPAFSVFYRSDQGDLFAVATRGDSPYDFGHRVPAREGVVGWAALRQMALTHHDAARLIQGDGPDGPGGSGAVAAQVAASTDFSLCLPVVNGSRTLGVILVGPTEREMPVQSREIGRTIALITAVTIAHTVLLREQEVLAKTDFLTGLLNRAHVIRTLDALVNGTGSFSQISLFLFDVDHFKQYNDGNGHLAGDELLKSLATLLQESVRDGELVGRYGGEEFLLVMPGSDGEVALAAAERIRKRIADYAFKHGAAQPLGAVTVSGGVATWPVDGAGVTEVLHRADEALYAAKRSGRNRVLAYTPDLPSELPEPVGVAPRATRATRVDRLDS